MPVTSVGENPFDRYLSPETKQKMQELKSVRDFQQAQVTLRETTEESFKLSHLHSEEWKSHQKHQHTARREEAEAEAPVEVRHRLLANQEEQDAADDKRFGWIRCNEHLLQVRGHEEYLRASRSWERRLAESKETGVPIPAPWTAGRMWVVGTLVLFVVGMLAAAKENILGAIILACIGLPVWAMIAKLPSIMGDFGTTGQRGGGNAV